MCNLTSEELESVVMAGLLNKEYQNYTLGLIRPEYLSKQQDINILNCIVILKPQYDFVDSVLINNTLGKDSFLFDIVYRLDEIKEVSVDWEQFPKYCQLLCYNGINKLISKIQTRKDYEKVKAIENGLNFLEERETIETIASRFLNQIENPIEKLSTGFKRLDTVLSLEKGGFYILGGSTGCGKSAFALNLAKNICDQGKAVFYVSMEMSNDMLFKRLVKAKSLLSDKEHLKRTAINISKTYKLYFADKFSNVTCENIAFQAKQIMNTQQLDLLIIDYLGLIQENNGKTFYEKVTLVSRKLKLLATTLNLPILCLAQLKRPEGARVFNPEARKPILSDLRDSGAIEQDADAVLFVYRDFCFNQEAPEGEMKLIIAKNRSGESNLHIDLCFATQSQLIFETP